MHIPVGYANASFQISINGRIAPTSINVGIADIGEIGPQATATAVAAALMHDDGPAGHGVGVAWSNNFTWDQVNLTYMTDTGPVQATANIGRTGTVNWDTAPSNFAILVRKVTNRGGRAGRGRMFVPAMYVEEDEINQVGVISGTNVTYVQGLFDTFLDEVNSLNTAAVLLHNDALMQPDPIVAFQVQPLGATQRRRMR